MTAARTYIRKPRGYLPGLGHEDDVDVTSLGEPPVIFTVEQTPTADDFAIAYDTWNRLGKPDRIRVTVEAAEAT